MKTVVLQISDKRFFQGVNDFESVFGYQLYQPEFCEGIAYAKVLTIGSHAHQRTIEYLTEYGFEFTQIEV